MKDPEVLRDKFIEDLRDSYVSGFADGYKQGLMDATRWIPVTERLPEEDGHYIVAVKNGWFPNNVIPIDILRYEGGKWKYYFGFENDDFEDDDFENPITAWLPLPEPYEEADE